MYIEHKSYRDFALNSGALFSYSAPALTALLSFALYYFSVWEDNYRVTHFSSNLFRSKCTKEVIDIIVTDSIWHQTIYSDHCSLFGFNLHNFGYAIVWLECLLPPSELRRKNTGHLFPECLIWQNIIKDL